MIREKTTNTSISSIVTADIHSDNNVQNYRREFLSNTGKALIGLFLASEIPIIAQLNVDTNNTKVQSKNYSPSEIDYLISSNQQDIKESEAVIRRGIKELSPVFKYNEKYGSTDKPKLAIRKDFEYKPVDYEPFRFVTAKKDQGYYNILFRLYETSKTLNTIISAVPMDEKERNNALLDLENLLDQSLRGKTYYFNDVDGFKVESTLHLASLIEHIAKEGINKSSHTKKDEFILESAKYYGVINQLRNLAPNMLNVVSEPFIAMNILDKTMRRMLDNYPSVFPNLIIYPDEKQYLSNINVGSNSAANHNSFNDVIKTYAKELWQIILNLGHEYGHVISRIDEHVDTIKASYYQTTFKNMEVYVEQRKGIVERLKELKSETEPTIIEQLNEEIREALQRSDDELSSLNKEMKRINSISIQKTKSAYLYQLEEASAYLFEDIVLNEYTKDNPSLGRLLLKLREWDNHNPDTKKYWGANRFAEELKRLYNGDALSAFIELAYLTDEKKINKYIEMLKPHNATFDEFNRGVIQEVVIKRKKAEIDKRISVESAKIGKIKDWNEPIRNTYIERIKETQRNLAQLYVQYLDYLY